MIPIDVREAMDRLRALAVHCGLSPQPPAALEPWCRAQTVADLNAVLDALQEARAPSKARNKIPPDPAEVTAYSAEIGYPMDGQAWCDHYAVKGWAIGSSKMKDWQAAVRLWKVNGWGENGIALKPPRAPGRPPTNFGRF